MFDFTDQVVIVTGGSGNLGSAVVRAFYAANARLIVPDRALEKLPALFPELVNSERHYLAVATDPTQADAMETLVQATLTRFGRIDILVNTVGGYRAGAPPHETPPEDWDFMLDLNARATFIMNRAVIPSMLAQGRGKIINTLSKSALGATANDVAYSAAKSAAARITESMAAAYKNNGINVNAIMPGTIDTPQNRAARPQADSSKWVAPEAIAQVVLFLASDAASIIHGALIPVYGLS